jgi:hypothetical protein
MCVVLKAILMVHICLNNGGAVSNMYETLILCGNNWLYEEASLKKSGSSLLNSARKQ